MCQNAKFVASQMHQIAETRKDMVNISYLFVTFTFCCSFSRFGTCMFIIIPSISVVCFQHSELSNCLIQYTEDDQALKNPAFSILLKFFVVKILFFPDFWRGDSAL